MFHFHNKGIALRALFKIVKAIPVYFNVELT